MVIDQYARHLVIDDNIAFDNHIICRHHQNSRARGNAGHSGTWRGKVGDIVIENKVVANNHIVGGFDRQARGDKGEDATAIVVGVVVLHYGVAAVLDFDTGDTVEDFVVRPHEYCHSCPHRLPRRLYLKQYCVQSRR